jgi:hypothetical protein
MSGYLAFDRERVQALALASRRAHDELASCCGDDPLAADARATVRSVREAMEGWASRLAGLTACVALEAYRPVALDGASPALALPRLLHTERGWSVTTDPLDGPAVVGSDVGLEARALGDLLRDGDPAALLAGDERGWLDGELARIAGNRGASRQFLAALGDDGLARLCDAYGRQRFDAAQSDDRAAREAADAAIGALATILTRASSDPSRPPTVLLHVQPYAAALVIRHLDLDAATLGELCVAVLARWHGEVAPGGEPWFDDPHVALEESTGDLLFARLLEVPGAATEFAVRACADDPWLLMRSTYDLARFQQVVLTATDPRWATTDQAGQVIVPLLGCLRDAQPPLGGSPIENFNSRDWLGDLVAPWVWQLSYRSSEWGLDLQAANGWLRFVLDDREAMATLIAARDSWLAALAEREVDLSDWAAAMDSLRRLQFVIGQLTAVADEERMTDAFSAQAAWGTSWLIAQTALAIGTSGLAPVAGLALGGGATTAQELLPGVAGLPDPEQVGDDEDSELDAQLVRSAGSLLASVDRALRQAGELPAGYPPIPTGTAQGCGAGELRRAVDVWLARPDLPPTARARVQEVADVVLGHWAAGYSSGQTC